MERLVYTKSKYVVGEILTRDLLGSVFGAVVVSELVPHAALKPLFVEGSIVGAGFCHSDEASVYVYGESTGLGVKSRAEDVKHVARALAHQTAIGG